MIAAMPCTRAAPRRTSSAPCRTVVPCARRWGRGGGRRPPGGAQPLWAADEPGRLRGPTSAAPTAPAVRPHAFRVGRHPALRLELDRGRGGQLARPAADGGDGSGAGALRRALHRSRHRRLQRVPVRGALRALVSAGGGPAGLPHSPRERPPATGAVVVWAAYPGDRARIPEPALPAAPVPLHPGLGGEHHRTPAGPPALLAPGSGPGPVGCAGRFPAREGAACRPRPAAGRALARRAAARGNLVRVPRRHDAPRARARRARRTARTDPPLSPGRDGSPAGGDARGEPREAARPTPVCR